MPPQQRAPARNFQQYHNRNKVGRNVGAKSQSAQQRNNPEPSMVGSILNGVGSIMNIVGKTIDTIGTTIKNFNNVDKQPQPVNKNNNGFNPRQGETRFNSSNLEKLQKNGYIPARPFVKRPSTNISGQTRSKSIWSKTKVLCCLK
ncbi:hypothetical protein P8452_30141 [Trifolium repens]|nr:hypothetical protein P8452_30141 [Trifolium repens]